MRKACGPPLWDFVPVEDYQLPSGLEAGEFKRKWSALKRFFHGSPRRDQSPVKAGSELRALAQARLEQLVPPIDWTPAAQALDRTLEAWTSETPPQVPVSFLIGQPYCGHLDTLQTWAAVRAATLIAAPDHTQILSGDRRWLECWPEPNGVWVLPSLEHCFLRHANGLELIRRLLEKATSGALGRGLIGCDSWAWAYLQRIWAGAPTAPTTLQAFDGARLTELFARLAGERRGQQLRFCNARTGQDIIPARDRLEDGDYDISTVMKELAGYCRGNVGTAWTYWRESLRTEPEHDDTRPPAPTASGDLASDEEAVVWVAAEIAEPRMPVESGEDTTLLLHALLIHNGLTPSILPELLPLPPSRIEALLLGLRAAGLAQWQGNLWRVAPGGYAATRAHLLSRGFLTDSF